MILWWGLLLKLSAFRTYLTFQRVFSMLSNRIFICVRGLAITGSALAAVSLCASQPCPNTVLTQPVWCIDNYTTCDGIFTADKCVEADDPSWVSKGCTGSAGSERDCYSFPIPIICNRKTDCYWTTHEIGNYSVCNTGEPNLLTYTTLFVQRKCN